MYAAGIAGLGQTQRALNLAQYICAAFETAVVSVATGVPAGDRLFASARIPVISPPEVVELVDVARRMDRPRRSAGGAAAAKLLSLATEFDPDVFVTTTHAGIAGELVPLLKLLRNRGCRRVLALRDVYWPPRYSDEFAHLSTSDFDDVIFGGTEETMSRTPACFLRGTLAQRHRFVGYLRPLQVMATRGDAPTTLIACQTGSGRDGYDLAATIVNLAPILQQRLPGCRLLVLSGPLMPKYEQSTLSALAENGKVTVETWTTDPFGSQAEFAKPDVTVTMAGYNTCVEAAWFGSSTILCPRQQFDDSEQQIRARIFSDHFDNISLLERPSEAHLLRAISDPPPSRSGRLPRRLDALFADPRDVAHTIVGAAP